MAFVKPAPFFAILVSATSPSGEISRSATSRRNSLPFNGLRHILGYAVKIFSAARMMSWSEVSALNTCLSLNFKCNFIIMKPPPRNASGFTTPISPPLYLRKIPCVRSFLQHGLVINTQETLANALGVCDHHGGAGKLHGSITQICHYYSCHNDAGLLKIRSLVLQPKHFVMPHLQRVIPPEKIRELT